MLLYIKDISSHSAYGVWKITEPLEDLEVNFTSDEKSIVKDYHIKRKCEYYATRILLKSLCEHVHIPYGGIRKDDHGKPFLNNSEWHISISHAYPYVACLVNQNSPCGIDIEAPRQQLQKIQYKFLSKSELILVENDLDLLCKFWCAKEALYKIHGRRSLIFAENIKVNLHHDGSLIGQIIVEEVIKEYPLSCVPVDDYFIVFNI